jgi:hypothetical protein
MYKFLKQLLGKSLMKHSFTKLWLPISLVPDKVHTNKRQDQRLEAAAKNHTDKKELVELEPEQLGVQFGGAVE